MVPSYRPAARIPVRGAGSRWWDQDGVEVIDFAAGIAVNALGHAHPRLVEALAQQAGRLWHVANLLTNEPALRLASLLTTHTFAERVFFCNSGGEANEAAFKLARRWGNARATGKNRIVSCLGSFHGRTLFTVSVGGQAKYSAGFEPLVANILHVPFNDVHALEAALTPEVCAFVVEPVQGEGGVTPASQEFLQRAAALCRQHEALLIFDEVQSGNGRTGTLYAYEQLGVVPDVLTTGKGLAGGFPIGAMLTTTALSKALPVGAHGSTFGGNPLACAVGEAVVSELLSPALRQNVHARAKQLRTGLDEIGSRHGMWGATRGLGLLLGAPLSSRWVGESGAIVAAALADNVSILQAGVDVLRFAPALNIKEEDVAEGLTRLAAACGRMSRSPGR